MEYLEENLHEWLAEELSVRVTPRAGSTGPRHRPASFSPLQGFSVHPASSAVPVLDVLHLHAHVGDAVKSGDGLTV